jgi:ATP-binding cassette subfamily B protein
VAPKHTPPALHRRWKNCPTPVSAKVSMHDEEVLGKAYDARLMRRLITYLRPYRKVVAIAILLIIFESGLEAAFPWLTKIAIDRYIANSNVAGLTAVALGYVFLLVAKWAAASLQTLILQGTGQKIMYDMRMQVFRHLQNLPPAFYDRNPVGRLITRVTTDVDVLNELFSAGIVSIFGDIFTLIGIMIAILLLDWELGLVTLSVVPLIGITTAIFRKKARESYRRIRVAIAKINAYLQEHITGMTVVQLYNRER